MKVQFSENHDRIDSLLSLVHDRVPTISFLRPETVGGLEGFILTKLYP